MRSKCSAGCLRVNNKRVPYHQVAWDGTVEVFALKGHPKAKRAFAWTYEENGSCKTTAVLEIPPVDSPQVAVKIALAAKGREKR